MTKFIDVLTKTQSEMLSWFPSVLLDYGYTDLKVTDYMIMGISPKENQVCLVAHLDTINTKSTTYSNYVYGKGYVQNTVKETEKQRTPKKKDILVTRNYILLSPEHNPKIKCLGADDRVGVKTILDVLEAGLRPHILFTTDEEVGCVGSRKSVSENALEELKKASMLVQIDRGVHEGSWHEMVTYDFDPKSHPAIFEKLSETYTMANGSFTDVAVLGEHLNKPIVNVSASYKNEHRTNEFINLKAYKHNTQGLINFIEWAEQQDTSDWKYVEKYKAPVVVKRTTYRPACGEPRSSLWDSKAKKYADADTYLDEMNATTFLKPKTIYDRYVKDGWDEEIMLDSLDLAYSMGMSFKSIFELYYILEGKVYDLV